MIYSVCSTGATIYLHHCGKNTVVSVLDKAKGSHDHCPMCQDEDPGKPSPGDEGQTSHHEGCQDTDLNLDLKSETEQKQPTWIFGKMFDFSPAIVLLPWIWTWLDGSTLPVTPIPRSIEPLAVANLQDTYLLHCIFRI